jgi:hypothetical protein
MTSAQPATITARLANPVMPRRLSAIIVLIICIVVSSRGSSI